MFQDAIIVQSAASAFNNAALAGPAFIWWAILSVPVFVMARICGSAFMDKIGLRGSAFLHRSALFFVLMTMAWIVMFGGNYDVLRDPTSALPFMIAAIVFVCSMFAGTSSHSITRDTFRNMPRRRRIGAWAIIATVLIVLGMSDLHAWWGPLVQIGAAFIGFMIGRIRGGQIRPVATIVLVMMAAITAILMQPEFFRFGQLGNLSLMHLAALLATAGAAVSAVALYNVAPRGRIGAGMYGKLKWLMRCAVLLCVVLFFLTESVPVFLCTAAAIFARVALSVWHSKKIANGLAPCVLALALGLFGVVTVMPAIGILGILFWINDSYAGFWRDAGRLL